MAAAITDLFRKGMSGFVSALSAGITSSDATIGVDDLSGYPDGTAITLTIDRVDANGVATPTKTERVTGIISGNNLTSCLRGQDGTTAQAHSSGAVIEDVWDADRWNDAVDGIVTEHSQLGAHSLSAFSHLNAHEGFLINGKIVPSVSSNNLTVALKGMDGNDPSASNPVYVRIGSTIRTITSALSITKNAGTNWCNAGSAELATKEIDYFVYLGYNTTDGVVIGFSRIPYARIYSDFNTTSTNARYCAISTITHASSSDSYTVIGRFAATLSAGAGYTWTVPTFTNANLIQQPIFETRTLTWTPTISYQFGTTAPTSNTVNISTYRIKGGECWINLKETLVVGSFDYQTVKNTVPISSLYDTVGLPTNQSVFRSTSSLFNLHGGTAFFDDTSAVSLYCAYDYHVSDGTIIVMGAYPIV